VEAEAQAVSPGRAGVGRQRTAAPGCLTAVGEVTRLPRGELEEAGHQDDHTDRDRYGARQRRLLHLDRRQRDASGKAAIPNTVQTEKYPTPTSAVSRPRRVSPVLSTAWR
jgi:hypothetical protein